MVGFLKQTSLHLKLIATPQLVEKWPIIASDDLILTSAPIYSAEEQLRLPFLIPPVNLFWTPHFNAPLLPIRAKKRLVTLHDVYHLAHTKKLPLLKRVYAHTVIKSAARIADHILTISSFSKEEIIKYTKTPEKKISVVHLGVDSTHFQKKGDASIVRQKYQLPNRYFIFVGTLLPHKNVERLIHAWSRLPQRHLDWKLVIIGKTVKNNPVHARQSERVLFLGEVDQRDLPYLYQEAYCAIHPSLYEGFGLTPLEAMSCDCPTLVSNAASLPEVCGEASLYIDPYDVDDMVLKICELIEKPALRQTLIQKGRERVELFRWEKTAEKHLEVIERIL